MGLSAWLEETLKSPTFDCRRRPRIMDICHLEQFIGRHENGSKTLIYPKTEKNKDIFRCQLSRLHQRIAVQFLRLRDQAY